jgi:hypothetical protein
MSSRILRADHGRLGNSDLDKYLAPAEERGLIAVRENGDVPHKML